METTRMPNTPLLEERVPLASRIGISGADAATDILQTLVAASALYYYFIKLRGLNLELYGLAWLLFGLWNAVNDPLFGYISDRTKSNLGRRIPYIRFGAPLFVLAFISFWINLPGSQGNQTILFIQMLLALFVYDILYTAIATSIYVLPYEVAVSNKARSGIYLWKIIFMVFTLVVPLGIERTIKPDVGDTAGIGLFRIVMMLLGILMGSIIFASTFFYKEKHYIQLEEQPGFLTSLKECFKNRSFVLFETISFTMIFAKTVLMQGIWLYFDEIDVSPLPLYLALVAGIIVGVFLWITRRDRWGVKKCVLLMCLLFATGCFSLLFFGRQTPLAAIGFFLFGIGFSGGMYLIPLMNGDVVDMDEHRTGLRREGMYAGINSFITKPAISIAQWVLSTVTAIYGFNQALPKGAQSISAENGILVGWTATTGILLVICFLALLWYPLSGPAWEKIKNNLADIHAEKERRYLATHASRMTQPEASGAAGDLT